MSQRVLVTGGLGYLGSRLTGFLESRAKYNVIPVSRQKICPSECFRSDILHIDWRSATSLDGICRHVGVIIHLAGMNAPDCAADPVAALEVNGLGTARLLDAAIRQGVKRFIYVSTAHVYGAALEGKITEDTCPTNVHPYASSHRAGEDVVRYAHCHGAIEGIVVRLSNAYGAPAHKDANCWMLLVNDLCRQAVTRGRLGLKSAGTQRRDFVTLEDVCRAVEHLMTLSSREIGDGLFNVGGGWAPTVLEMASLIAERCKYVLGFRPEIVRPGDARGHGSARLDYRIDKLLATGFELKSNRNEEVDMTLKMCHRFFGIG